MADLTGMLQAAAGASTGNPNAWDISAAFYGASGYAGNISKLGTSYTLIISEETSCRGIFIKPDGTKMYIVGQTGDDVNEYNLSLAWALASRTYVQNFSVASQDSAPQDIFFKDDGTKMYICGGATGQAIYEYSLSTAWDISSASYVTSFSVSSQETSPTGLWFKADGTKMYVVGNIGDAVNEYDLSTAWDISSASYLQNFSVSSEETSPRAVAFLADGTKMYIGGTTDNAIDEYDLSTPWDISTSSFNQTKAVGDTDGLYVNNDGSLFFTCTADDAFQFFVGSFYLSQETAGLSLTFKPDGTKMYVGGQVTDAINEFDLSTAWDVTTASYVQNFSTSPETAPSGIFFKSNGLKMYVIGSQTDSVYEYDLSVAWDVSTASLLNTLVPGVDTNPQDIFFKDDGTKMYILGATGDDVNEFDLSTAWDISTASYVQNFSVASQTSVPTGLSFKTDGTKMYVAGNEGKIYEYNLSTAWNISTASYLQNFSGLQTATASIYFREDGEMFFICGTTTDQVLQYSISST